MNYSKYIKSLFRVSFDFLFSLLLCFILAFFVSQSNVAEVVSAEGLFSEDPSSGYNSETSVSEDPVYPYTKTFRISAYYSPLPCQNRYVTGSYSGDIRLNGNGTNGADGTEVYLGFIAAPRNFPFGTKMYIPGLGIGAVHDRGGAIVNAGSRSNKHDRLDVWMGWGDKGLNRALRWGKRDLDVTVFGDFSSVIEGIELDDFSFDERIPNECTIVETNNDYSDDVKDNNIPDLLNSAPEVVPETFVAPGTEDLPPPSSDLKFGDDGKEIVALQVELNRLNFYKGPFNGEFDNLTQHAVYKFQQSHLLVGDKNSPGAGIFGPKTRNKLISVVNARKYSRVLVASTTADNQERLVAWKPKVLKSPIIAYEMDYGFVDPSVKVLQDFLKKNGYFDGRFTTDYFGEMTKTAVLKFQKAHNLVSNENDVGAGRVGPATLELINRLG